MERSHLARVSWAVGSIAFATASLAAQGAAPTTPAAAASDATVVEKGLGESLDAEATSLAALGFNGSVLVAQGDKVLLCKGYGLADREKKIANAPGTLFDIGSLTKQFTAAAIFTLVEQKKLKTSDLLSKYVGAVPKDKAAITLHHLLTHTSGLPREVRIGSATVQRDAMVKAALATKLLSKPGAEFCYTNAGYDLLGAVVEIASGESFEDYVTERLFDVAGLEHTTFLHAPPVAVANDAVGYEDARRIGAAHEGWYSWGLRGAGGVLSNVVELERWWRALDGGKLLSAESRKELLAPELLDYACGWWVRHDDEFGAVIEHSGTTRGFESSFAHYPDHDLVVIVLSNERETCKPTANTLARAAAGLEHVKAPAGVALAPQKLEQCVGTYFADKNTKIDIRSVGARLALQLSPEAVVLFSSGRGVDTLSEDPKLAKKISEILLRMRSGDATGLNALISTEWPGWNQQLVGVWRDWTVERGAYVRNEVLGTDHTGDALRAFVRLDFANGSFVLAMTFHDERWSGFEIDAGVPAGPAFVANSETEFGWLDPKSYGARSCKLVFERDAKGRATMFTIQDAQLRSLLAKRDK